MASEPDTLTMSIAELEQESHEWHLVADLFSAQGLGSHVAYALMRAQQYEDEIEHRTLAPEQLLS